MFSGVDPFLFCRLTWCVGEEVSALLVEKSLLRDLPGGPIKHQDFPQNSEIEHTCTYIQFNHLKLDYRLSTTSRLSQQAGFSLGVIGVGTKGMF
jgi:hypothetical protein